MKVVNDCALKFAFFVGRVPPSPLTATFVVKAGLKLVPGGVAELLPEDQQPEFSGDQFNGDDPSKGLRYASDFALFKPGSEVLAAGHCHAPAGTTIPQAEVVISVGGWTKRLLVFGDRLWVRGPFGASVSDPLRFSSMPLTWVHSFGGQGDRRNPVGRGVGETALENGGNAHLLPNIESASTLVRTPDDRPVPAGFAPVDPASLLRSSKTGTYNGEWLKERWPWLPDDFDWTFFNAALPDQQFQGQFLRGDELVRFDNMHPQVASYQSKLPGDRVRLFVKRRRSAELMFEEVELRLDTLFADMDAETITLIWRGVTAADSLKLKEFEEFFLLKEPLGAPLARDLRSYRDLFETRLAEIEKADAGEFKPPAPFFLTPPREPDVAWAERLNAKMDALEAEAAQEVDSGFDAALAKVMGGPRPTALPSESPPGPTSIAEGEKLIKAALTEHARKEPGTMRSFENVQPDFAAIEAELDRRLAEMPTALEPDEGENADEDDWTREKVQAHAKNGGTFEGQDLSGLDLSNLDLSGCSFKEASLGETRLGSSRFDGCDLSGANLTQAILTETSFRASRLDSADLSGCKGTGACFAEANLSTAEFTGGTLAGADFSGCAGRHASFDECDLSGARFDGCTLRQPDFSNATLQAATFNAAEMPDAAFYGASGGDASFDGAVMPRVRFSGADCANLTFTKCQLELGVFDDARLDHVNFTEATLTGSSFTGARLSHAMFHLARCERAKFDDTVATDARFVQTNLFRASFENADLSRALFWDSNCYEVEFFNSRTGEAAFKETNLKGTKLA